MMSGVASTACSSASMPLPASTTRNPENCEVLGVHLARILIVVDDAAHAGVRLCLSFPSPASAIVSVNVEPFPTLAAQRDPAAEHLRQPAADRQAEAGAAVCARRRVVDLAEVFEDLAPDRPARCRCRCRPPTDRQPFAPASRATPIVDAALVRELQRVAQQVERGSASPSAGRSTIGGRSFGDSRGVTVSFERSDDRLELGHHLARRARAR